MLLWMDIIQDFQTQQPKFTRISMELNQMLLEVRAAPDQKGI